MKHYLSRYRKSFDANFVYSTEWGWVSPGSVMVKMSEVLKMSLIECSQLIQTMPERYRHTVEIKEANELTEKLWTHRP